MNDETTTMKSIATTQNALGVVAGWMAQEENIKIVWNNGGECVADLTERTLSIPRLVESDMLDGDNLWLARGHIYHEAGHLAETQIDDRVDNAGLHAVVNALDDRRMEHVMASKYAGCGIAFKKSMAHYNAELSKKFVEGKAPAQYEALCALSFEVEGQAPQWKLSDEASEICNLVRDDFGKVFNCRNTRETVDLAIVIWDKLKKDDEEKGQQQKRGGSSQDGDEKSEDKSQNSGDNENKDGGSSPGESKDADNDSERNGEGDQAGQSEQGGDGNGGNSSEGGQNADQNSNGNEDGGSGQQGEEPQDNGSGAAQGNQSGNGSDQTDGKGNPGKDASDKSDAKDGDQAGQSKQGGDGGKSLEAAMAKADAECGRDAIEGQAFKKILDEEKLRDSDSVYTSYRGGDRHFPMSADSGTREQYKAALEECSGEAAILARTLEEYLRTITRTKMLHCQRRGKIDPRRFAQMAKGLSREVFRHLSDKRDMDTAVEIVFDESGSMGEYLEVRKAIMIIAEALDRVSIPFEITGGTTMGGHFPRGFTRANPIEFHHYKTFEQNWTQVRSAIQRSGSFRNFIDGEMVEFAAARLMTRPERRKIIFTLSDGCPCGGEWNDYALGRKLIRVCSECRKAGIEVYSFGVNTDEPAKYYNREFFVKLNQAEIGKGLSTGITAVMTRGRMA